MINATRALVSVIAAALAATSFGSPALAAQPEVKKQACQEGGGAYDSDRGLRTCTTTSTALVPGAEALVFWATSGSRPQCEPIIIDAQGTRAVAPFVFDGVRSSDSDWGVCSQGGSGVRGTLQPVSLVETTVVRSQRGNGEVLRMSSDEVLSTSVVTRACERFSIGLRSFTPSNILISRTVHDDGPADLAQCEQLRGISSGTPWPDEWSLG